MVECAPAQGQVQSSSMTVKDLRLFPRVRQRKCYTPFWYVPSSGTAHMWFQTYPSWQQGPSELLEDLSKDIRLLDYRHEHLYNCLDYLGLDRGRGNLLQYSPSGNRFIDRSVGLSIA